MIGIIDGADSNENSQIEQHGQQDDVIERIERGALKMQSNHAARRRSRWTVHVLFFIAAAKIAAARVNVADAPTTIAP